MLEIVDRQMYRLLWNHQGDTPNSAWGEAFCKLPEGEAQAET